MKPRLIPGLAALALALGLPLAGRAAERVEVTHALVRATSEGQGTGIAFVDLRAFQHATLVGASSPVCETVALHEMRSEKRGGVTNLSMQPIASVDLAAGERVSLKAGGRHLMLLHLKNQLVVGAVVPFELRFVDAAGQPFSQQVTASVTGVGVLEEDDH